MNHVTLIGNAGKDPESRTTQSGKPVVKFSLATSKRWKDSNGERQEQTTWHNLVCFQPGLCGVIEKYIHKGSKIAVTGEISNRSYEQDGQTKYMSEVVIRDMEMLDSKPSQDRSEGQVSYAEHKGGFGAGANAGALDDDIPFDRA